jgi:hypothetical protein
MAEEGTTPVATPEAVPAVAPAKNPAYPQTWMDRAGIFAVNVGKTVEEITAALAEVVGEPGDQALAILADEESAPFDDLKNALASLKIPIGVLRKNLPVLRGPKPVVEETMQLQTINVLPPIPKDIPSFLESLKVGGILKPQECDVIAAARAGFASRLNIFDLPTILLEKMKVFASEQEEPCGKQFYELRHLIARRTNAELFAALGLDANAVTVADKKAFLEKLDSLLWPGLFSFNQTLKDVYEAYLNLLNQQSGIVLASALSKTKVVQTVILRTDSLRDAAEAFINRLNRIFAGVGIPAGRALAWDASKIKEIMEKPEIPSAIGATNRDQMLKMLGIGVEADVVRMEQDLSQFAVAIMHLPKVGRGQEELDYVQEMYMVSTAIPWDKLVTGTTSARSGRLPKRDPESY